MTKDEAMRIALETLENNRYIIESEINPPQALEEVDVAIAALHQALEQPEQEPVAWLEYGGWGDLFVSTEIKGGFPVYTAPPSKPWVSLTDEEIDEYAEQSWVSKSAFESVAWFVEEKLKEKNSV